METRKSEAVMRSATMGGRVYVKEEETMQLRSYLPTVQDRLAYNFVMKVVW